MFKKFLCLLLVLFALSTPFTAFAESDAHAYLSDVTTEAGKVFETNLSVTTEVAAFVATLEFDESKVEFKGATPLSQASEISVNNSEKGKVILAFLNETGTEGEILKLTFKSITANTFIDLKLEQIIDPYASDINFKSIKGAEVIISSESADKNKEKEDLTKTDTQSEESDTAKGNLSLSLPAEKETYTLTFICILFAVLILSVGVTGFILGKNINSKNKNRKNNYEKDS